MSITRILVTGANGFIGRNLVAKLSENSSFQIISVDLHHSDFLSPLNNIEFIDCDLTNPDSVKNLPSVDYVFHLAAINGTQRFYSEPWFVFFNSIVPTINLVNHYKDKHELKRFIYTSSSEVYADRISSDNSEKKTGENVYVGFNNVLNPRWSYGGAKLAGEIAVNSASIENGLKFTILRYHNVYGPNMGVNHVIPDFMNRGNLGVYKLYGGNNVRSFIHIEDAVRATTLAGFAEESLGRIVHIGNESPVTMIELAEIIMKVNNWVGNVEIEKAPEGSTNFRCPDTSFLRNVLGFSSEYDLTQGIRNYLEYQIQG